MNIPRQGFCLSFMHGESAAVTSAARQDRFGHGAVHDSECLPEKGESSVMSFDSHCIARDARIGSCSPWKHVVCNLLAYPSAPSEIVSCVSQAEAAVVGKSNGVASSSNCTITIEDRLENRRVVLSWSDSTSCSYRGQLWRYAIARRAGTCALSGRPIRRGDAVFRPQSSVRSTPRNRGAMILAASIDFAETCSG